MLGILILRVLKTVFVRQKVCVCVCTEKRGRERRRVCIESYLSEYMSVKETGALCVGDCYHHNTACKPSHHTLSFTFRLDIWEANFSPETGKPSKWKASPHIKVTQTRNKDAKKFIFFKPLFTAFSINHKFSVVLKSPFNLTVTRLRVKKGCVIFKTSVWE